MITTVTREELQHLVRHGEVVLLEALPPLYFDTEHLPGAQNLPLDEVETLAPKIVPDKTTPIVTYCTGLACPIRRSPQPGCMPSDTRTCGLTRPAKKTGSRPVSPCRAPRRWRDMEQPLVAVDDIPQEGTLTIDFFGREVLVYRGERATSRHCQRVHPSRRTAAVVWQGAGVRLARRDLRPRHRHSGDGPRASKQSIDAPSHQGHRRDADLRLA